MYNLQRFHHSGCKGTTIFRDMQIFRAEISICRKNATKMQNEAGYALTREEEDVLRGSNTINLQKKSAFPCGCRFFFVPLQQNL
jgi:hypothetical protein